MKFNIDDYKGKYVMHCKTEEEAKDFCNYLHGIGKRWNNYTSYLDTTDWSHYKSNTVYYFNKDLYWNIDSAKRDNYTILEWSDFMNGKFTKADLKTGDIIKQRNGDVRIVMCKYNICLGTGSGISLDYYHEDLTAPDERLDIVAVKRPNVGHDCSFLAFENNYGTLVYERKEVEEMTLAEVCKLLGKEIKIVK